MEELVSVIIVNFNNNIFTINCLESLKNQTYRNFEVLLVDNGSNYSLFLKLKEELNQFKHLLNINLIRNNKNLYFGAGNNKAIRLSNGKYICLLNNDIIAEADFIEKMVEFLKNNPNVGFITPKIKFYEDKRFIWNAGAFINFKSTQIVNNRGFLEYDPSNKKYNKIEQIDFAPGTALFLRKKIINDIGLIDEIFMMYHEDPDWNLRAQMKGYKSFYVPTTTVYHNVPLDVKKRGSLFTYYFFKRNSQILIWKYAKLRVILIFYFLYFYMNIIDTFYYFIRRKKKIHLVQFNSIYHGFRIGIKRRTNRSCEKYLLNDYHYAQNLQKL
ncbi:MAG: glycosyltransferase family 2 protein [Promethearchaeota archaeon]